MGEITPSMSFEKSVDVIFYLRKIEEKEDGDQQGERKREGKIGEREREWERVRDVERGKIEGM